MRTILVALFVTVIVLACSRAEADLPFDVEVISSFDEPWAMAFLPDGRLLVTEKKGSLIVVTQDGEKSRPLGGVPDVDYGGQGGFGDVALHPNFDDNQMIYLSYVESGVGGTRGAAVARAVLETGDRGSSLSNAQVIWRQYPKTLGYGHYGHRLLFDGQGHLFVSSGDRQKFTPAQDMQSNIGKIVRLNDDGTSADGNPFADYYSQDPNVDRRGIYDQIWSLGHRNTLGLAWSANGELWNIEMGPAGGDELNRIVPGGNYGYPEVSNGKHYDGRDMPDHDTRDDFLRPAAWWTPVISPGDLMFYSGDAFPKWRGNAFVAGLSSRAIIRIEIDGDRAEEVERFEMGARIRSVVQGPEGNLWVLEDERQESEGRLLKLTPKR